MDGRGQPDQQGEQKKRQRTNWIDHTPGSRLTPGVLNDWSEDDRNAGEDKEHQQTGSEGVGADRTPEQGDTRQ